MNYTTSETEFAKIAGLSLQTIRNYRLGVTVKGKFYEPIIRQEEWKKIGRGIFYADATVEEFKDFKKHKEVKNI
jgi:hypothetical protein